MNTAAGSSGGRPPTRRCSASMPPAEAPVTTMSRSEGVRPLGRHPSPPAAGHRPPEQVRGDERLVYRPGIPMRISGAAVFWSEPVPFPSASVEALPPTSTRHAVDGPPSQHGASPASGGSPSLGRDATGCGRSRGAPTTSSGSGPENFGELCRGEGNRACASGIADSGTPVHPIDGRANGRTFQHDPDVLGRCRGHSH